MVASRTADGFNALQGFSKVDLGDTVRISLMLLPRGRGSFQEQAREIFSALHQALEHCHPRQTVTSQTVFLRDPGQLEQCERLLIQHYGHRMPATNFVLQPPCCGAALAVEAWAIGGKKVSVECCDPHTTAVSYDGVRWIYCSGIRSSSPKDGVYQQTTEVLNRMKSALESAGAGFERVVRTWFYLGGITNSDLEVQRYKELNRARSEFYREVHFQWSLAQANIPQGIYPASTGIGMAGSQLVAGCVALQTQRPDAFLLPLENPQQTPAYAYHPKFSPQSPKFSRGVALVMGDYITTWLSGTASVVHSISRHPGDIQRQTEQTIENIERLIDADNFSFHGVNRAGVRLRDLAKIRVYLKRIEDFPQCKAICDERFGSVPAIYAIADVCRPELLVEIEGVAFSRRSPEATVKAR